MVWLRALLLVLAPFCLALGLIMPLVRFEKLYFFRETPSLIDIVVALWTGGDALLALLVGLLSMAFPMLKLVGIAAEVVVPDGREKGLLSRLLPHLSRWSMMDVLLVAVVIFAAKTSGLAAAFTQPGLWFYAASSILAGVLHGLVHKRI